MKSYTMNQTEMTNHATNLLAKWLGVEGDEISEARFDCYGLTVLEIGQESYAIGDDSQACWACKEYIKEAVWAFNGSFIAEACGLPYELGEVLSGYSSEKCEGANDALLALVNRTCGFDSFASRAVGDCGRGHFLASYDGDEINLGDGLFAYRIG
jgi:hypothetical protein